MPNNSFPPGQSQGSQQSPSLSVYSCCHLHILKIKSPVSQTVLEGFGRKFLCCMFPGNGIYSFPTILWDSLKRSSALRCICRCRVTFTCESCRLSWSHFDLSVVFPELIRKIFCCHNQVREFSLYRRRGLS